MVTLDGFACFFKRILHSRAKFNICTGFQALVLRKSTPLGAIVAQISCLLGSTGKLMSLSPAASVDACLSGVYSETR
jgi:hypothetical protein